MEDIEMKILEALSDEATYTTPELTDQLGEESGVESALEALQTKAYVVSGEESTWMITDEGLDTYNQEIEREG